VSAHSGDLADGTAAAYGPLGYKPLFWLAAYAFPCLIAIVICVVLFAWTGQSRLPSGRTLEIRLLEDTPAALTPRQALEQLSNAVIVAGRDTKLSEAPFWFSFNVVPLATGEPIEVELPSRHAREVTCWDASTLGSLGFANRVGSAAQIRSAKSGFAIRLENLRSLTKILCRGTFSGPAHISVQEWAEAALGESSRRFAFDDGMLEGALTLLAAYMLVLAVVRKNATYLLVAVWVIATYRLSAITGGFAYQWLGYAIPPAWESPIRSASTALEYVITIAIVSRFLANTITTRWERMLLFIAQCAALIYIVVALTMSRQIWQATLWISIAFWMVAVILLLVRDLLRTGSVVLLLFCLASGVSTFMFFYDIVAGALGVVTDRGAISDATMALLSALLAAVAVELFVGKQETQDKLARQAAEGNYESSPIGFFKLDSDGKILHSNAAFRRLLSAGIEGRPYTAWSDCFDFAAWQSFRGELLRTGNADFEFSWPIGDETRLFRIQAAAIGNRIDGAMRDISGIAARPGAAHV
jgi:PAS domain-containing protein